MTTVGEKPKTLQDLDTPRLCLDLDAFDRNIDKVVGLCRDRKVDWRPHSKCHKSQEIGQRLVKAGAIGLTCAKLGEAEVMAAGGIADLLIANMLVGAHKVRRLVEVRRIADPITCVDSMEQATPISDAMAAAGLKCRAILEVDIGLNRVGVAPEKALDLARQVADLPGIEFAGVMGYEGHLLTIEDLDEKRERITEALTRLTNVADQIREADLPCPIVSCGGTGSITFCTAQAGITEVQAGGAIFMDEFYRHTCQVDFLEQALTIHATVVSRPAPDRAVIDAGRKSVNGDIRMPAVLEPSGLTVASLSAEHGALHVPDDIEVKVGDRVVLSPGYSDMTTVLHNDFCVHKGDAIEGIWPLQARGRLH